LPYFRDADTTLLNLTNRFNTKLNISDTTIMLSKYLRKLDTITLSNRINLKLNISDTASMLTPYFRDADTTSLNLTSRFATKLNISDTTNMLLPYLRKADTTSMLLPYFRDADTTLLNLTSRFNTKLNISDTLNMLSRYLRKADTTLMLLPYLRKTDTTNMLLPYFRDADTSLLNLTSRLNTKLNISDTTSMLLPYFRDSDTSILNLTSRFNTKLNLSDTTNMLLPYLRKADTTSMLLPYFRDADTTSLNLTSRFAAKQNTLNGTGFVKASGTNITYDNSSYLRTGLADSTYLKLTGGTLTGGLTGTTAGFNTKLTIGNVGGSAGSPILTAGLSGTETEVHFYQATGYEGSPTTLRLTNNDGSYYQNGLFFKSIMERGLNEYNGRIGIMGTDYITLTKNSRIGLFNSTPNYTFDITGTLGVTGAATLSSTLAVTGDITENNNNVLTNLDTVSLSNRIDAKYNSSGGTISGAVTLSTTTATPSTLLGKDGSNVVGTVTTLAQTGLMTRDIVTNASTISGSELINVTHGFITEPTAVLLTVFGSTSYILQVASKNSSTFTVQVKNYDGTPAIDATLISFSWLAIK
jgi:hypothetical protein